MLGILLLILIGAIIVLSATDTLFFGYWMKSFKYESTSFYIVVILLFLITTLLSAIRIKKVVKMKKVIYKIVESEHVEQIKEALHGFSEGYKTDLDKLYTLLNERKKLTVSEIAKSFDVSKKEAEEWGKILQEQNLIELHYPTVGEPELRWKSLSVTQ